MNLLTRLERQSLDLIRQELASAERQLALLERVRMETTECHAQLMNRRGQDVPFDIAHPLSLGLAGKRLALERDIDRRNNERQEIEGRLMDQLLEVKQWEKLRDRANQSEANDAIRMENGLIDEAASNSFRRR